MQFDLTFSHWKLFPFFKSTLPQPVQICVWTCTTSGRWCDQYWLPAVSQPVFLGRPDTPQPTGTSWMPLCSGQSLGTGLEEGSDLSMRAQVNMCHLKHHSTLRLVQSHYTWKYSFFHMRFEQNYISQRKKCTPNTFSYKKRSLHSTNLSMWMGCLDFSGGV